MKKVTTVLLLLLCLLTAVSACAEISVTDLDFEAEVVVTHSTNISVRKRADSKSDRLGWAAPGDCFTYLGESNGWFRISYNGRTGYVSNDLAQTYITESNNTSFVLVTHWNNVNLRSWCSENSDKLGMVAPETVLPYMGEQDGWYCVRFNGRKAYISENVSEVIDDAAGMCLASYSSSAY